MREESGRVIPRSIFPTEEATVLEFLGGMRGAIHVAFEEGTQAQWLYDLLVPVERIANGMRAELARVTLTRELTALTLRLWKEGEHYDPAKLTKQAR